MYTSPTERPSRMHALGRPVVSFSEASERLYLRFGLEHFLDEQLVPTAVRVPGQSVNRGAFSEPEDVLFHEEGRYDGLGVVEFFVQDVPTTIITEGSRAIFFMLHKPLSDNYSHSEIACDKTEPFEGDYPPSRSVKLKFRADLCKCIRSDRIRIHALRTHQ